MNKKTCFILIVLCSLLGLKSLNAQEFNITVNVSSAQVAGTDQRAFESLKEGITNFMNNRVWTNLKLEPEERIEGAMVVNVKKKTGNIIEAELNIALRRPTFKANYTTPLFNYIDNDFVFEYIESQPLDFTENSYMSNLTSTLAFYAY